MANVNSADCNWPPLLRWPKSDMNNVDSISQRSILKARSSIQSVCQSLDLNFNRCGHSLCMELVFFVMINTHWPWWRLDFICCSPATVSRTRRALALKKSCCPHLGNYKWIFCGGDLQKCLPQLVVSAVGLLETNACREVHFITYWEEEEALVSGVN